MHGVLFVLATPIGNLEDITLRALRVLRETDYVLAEDTRVTRKLLAHYDIPTHIVRLDAHKERGGVERILQDLVEGKHVALVSDAGTPCISDPGVRLVAAARAAGVRVEAVPGASSLTAALSVAGLPADEVHFLGFIPHKKGRQSFLSGALSFKGTTVFFESTHRIRKLMEELELLGPERRITIARELTKMHEEVVEGTASEVLELFASQPVKQKGEFVVLLHS